MVLLSAQSTGTISAKLIGVTSLSRRLGVSVAARRGSANPCAVLRDLGNVLGWPIEMRVIPYLPHIGLLASLFPQGLENSRLR